MRCRRADGTYYGTGGQCRKGIEAGELDWREKYKDRGGPELQKLISSMSKELESMPEDEREQNWDQWIEKSFLDHRTVHRDGTPSRRKNSTTP